jgi:DNA-binding transcriptional LysR family regulator
MELRVLRYFVQVARDESITRAASALHISQPTLSKQIKDLEAELGVKLFHRTNYSVRLTEDGIRLRLRAEDLLAMADQTMNEFIRKDRSVSGELRIGAAEGEAVRTLGSTMKILAGQYPGIVYHMYAGDTEALKEKLDSGFLDFLLVCEEPDLDRYQAVILPVDDQWGLVMKADDPMASKDSVTFEDIADLPLIVSRQALHQDLAHLFGAAAHRLHFAATYDLAHNASLLVKEGFGYLLTFDHIVDLSERSGLVFRPIAPELRTRSHLLYRRYQIFSPAAEVFLNALENELNQ